MGTEVMQPRDLLTITRVPHVPRRKFGGDGNLIVNRKGDPAVHRKAPPKQDQKIFHKGAAKAKKLTSAEPRRKNGGSDGGLVMGQVTLLRRGELLDSLSSKTKGGGFESTSPNRKPVADLAVLGPDLSEPISPLMVPKQINVKALADEYSGSAFYSSPSPRSVPVPSFFMKQLTHGEIKPCDDSATNDLRRLLRLD